MKRLTLPITSRRSTPSRWDTWTKRSRSLAAGAVQRARTPHTIQLLPIRMTVVRPRRTIRGTMRTGLIAAVTGGLAYYLGGHREQAAAARRQISTVGRSMLRNPRAQHNGADMRTTKPTQDVHSESVV